MMMVVIITADVGMIVVVIGIIMLVMMGGGIVDYGNVKGGDGHGRCSVVMLKAMMVNFHDNLFSEFFKEKRKEKGLW